MCLVGAGLCGDVTVHGSSWAIVEPSSLVGKTTCCTSLRSMSIRFGAMPSIACPSSQTDFQGAVPIVGISFKERWEYNSKSKTQFRLKTRTQTLGFAGWLCGSPPCAPATTGPVVPGRCPLSGLDPPGAQPVSGGAREVQPKSVGLQPTSGGLQPGCFMRFAERARIPK